MKQAIMVEPGKIEFREIEKPALNSGQVMM